MTIADNQVAPAEAWQRAGFGVNLGEIDAVDDMVACGVLASMVEDSERRLQMAQRAWEEQDGLGAQRLVGGANGEVV